MGTKYYNAHEVEKGDPQLNGPFLDDIRAEQEAVRREHRTKASKKKTEVDVLLSERKLAEEVDAKILKDPDKVRTTAAHDPTVVGRVPGTPGKNTRRPKKPRKVTSPSELDSLPPVSTEAEDAITEDLQKNPPPAKRRPQATKKVAEKKSVAKKTTVASKTKVKK